MNVSHGYHIFKDGSAWCAVGPRFIDLMQSPAGFGDTPEKAVEALHAEWKHDRWWDNKVMPTVDHFVIRQ